MNNMNPTYSIAERALWLVAATLLVFFARWNAHALDPELASQAALAYQKFALAVQPVFENPITDRLPYLAQWGAWVFRVFGVSEMSARLACDLPMAVASCAMLAWIWFRLGWATALAATLWLRPATPMAAYGLAAVGAAIATYECCWRPKIHFAARGLCNLLLLAAFFVSTATQGAAGMALWAGGFGSLLVAFLFSERAFCKLVFSFFAYILGFWISLAPFLWMFYGAFTNSGWPATAVNAFQGAVEHHSTVISGDWGLERWRPLASIEDFAREHGILVGIAPALGIAMFIERKKRAVEISVLLAWSVNVLCFFAAAAFAAGFMSPARALSSLNALTPLLWPLAGVLVAWLYDLAATPALKERFKSPALRWIALVTVALVALALNSRTRAQDRQALQFAAAAERIQKLPPSCEILVAADKVSEESMESLGAWYFRGRPWSSREHELPSAITVPAGQVYWDPTQDILWGQGACKI